MARTEQTAQVASSCWYLCWAPRSSVCAPKRPFSVGSSSGDTAIAL